MKYRAGPRHDGTVRCASKSPPRCSRYGLVATAPARQHRSQGGIGPGAALPALDPWPIAAAHSGAAWLTVRQRVLFCWCLPMTRGRLMLAFSAIRLAMF